jgi:hypothetical protein
VEAVSRRIGEQETVSLQTTQMGGLTSQVWQQRKGCRTKPPQIKPVTINFHSNERNQTRATGLMTHRNPESLVASHVYALNARALVNGTGSMPVYSGFLLLLSRRNAKLSR